MSRAIRAGGHSCYCERVGWDNSVDGDLRGGCVHRGVVGAQYSGPEVMAVRGRLERPQKRSNAVFLQAA